MDNGGKSKGPIWVNFRHIKEAKKSMIKYKMCFHIVEGRGLDIN